jgi:hypothetical protein
MSNPFERKATEKLITFWCHPVGCASTAIDGLHKGVLFEPGQSKIAYFNSEVFVHQQIW